VQQECSWRKRGWGLGGAAAQGCGVQGAAKSISEGGKKLI